MRAPRRAALLLAAALAAPAAFALGDLTAFSRVLTECIPAGAVRFGPGAGHERCEVTKARWFSTLGFLDLYQAQYCLGGAAPGCAQRALVLYANRAYTPVARMLLQRVDPGQAQYDDPVVLETREGPVLVLGMRLPGAPRERSYYRWHGERWSPIPASRQLEALAGEVDFDLPR